jgi:hypothetical protein
MEGKETLIKSVLQAISTYPMSCFRLSKKTCKSLKAVSSRFWWGEANGKGKIPWIAWDKMCLPKRKGGMGFQDFEAFNQALLAKQAWRLLTNPGSLCARVLRARYCKDGDILTAKCPSNASYTWRSILHGRDLLKESIIWRIGDGVGIKAMQDNWIPRSGLKRPWGIKLDKEVGFVSDLLLPDGQSWDEGKLQDVFYEGDVEDILKIPVGRAGIGNYVAWNYTKNRIFSVKSAYHLKMHIRSSTGSRGGPSLSLEEHQGWLALWGVAIPGKAKIHVWRLIKNGLAVGQELSRRQIKEGVNCIVCNREESFCTGFGHALIQDRRGKLFVTSWA